MRITSISFVTFVFWQQQQAEFVFESVTDTSFFSLLQLEKTVQCKCCASTLSYTKFSVILLRCLYNLLALLSPFLLFGFAVHNYCI